MFTPIKNSFRDSINLQIFVTSFISWKNSKFLLHIKNPLGFAAAAAAFDQKLVKFDQYPLIVAHERMYNEFISGYSYGLYSYPDFYS